MTPMCADAEPAASEGGDSRATSEMTQSAQFAGGQMFRALLGADLSPVEDTPAEGSQKVSGFGLEDSSPAGDEELESKPAAWAPNREEPAIRAMRSILNKLTRDKFETLYAQLLEHVDTCAHVEKLVSLVFEKSIVQHHFVPMYADLCGRLHKWLQAEQRIPGVPGDGFRKMLLDQCQVYFEKFLEPIPSGPSEDDEMKRQKLRKQMIGNAKLLGELLGRALVPSVVLFECCKELFVCNTEATLETLAALLTAVGPHFDNTSFRRRAQLEEVFSSVRALVQSGEVGARPRCLLQDVLDLRARQWQPAPAIAVLTAPPPQPRAQMSLQWAQSMAAQAAQAYPATSSSDNWRRAQPVAGQQTGQKPLNLVASVPRPLRSEEPQWRSAQPQTLRRQQPPPRQVAAQPSGPARMRAGYPAGGRVSETGLCESWRAAQTPAPKDMGSPSSSIITILQAMADAPVRTAPPRQRR